MTTITDPEQSARLTRARVHLLLDFPWFGSLAMRIKIVESTDGAWCPTFQVDGTSMWYNPSFSSSLSDAELVGVMAHEIMHCAMLHPFRRNGRDGQEWNVACDYAINGLLQQSGFTLPGDALLDSQYDGLAAETIFAKRESAKKPGDTPQQTGSTGSFSDPQTPASGAPDPNAPIDPNAPQSTQPQAGKPDPNAMSESDWQIASEQATRIAAKAGKMDGGVDRAVRDARETEADEFETLKQYVEMVENSDYTWSRPDRRFMSQGVYLPGVSKDGVGYLAIAVDTSGSIDTQLLAEFADKLSGLVKQYRPRKIQVLYCDTEVARTETFTPDDDLRLSACGGGGTYFQPVFDAIQADVDAGNDEPRALLYFTDLESADTPQDPGYPVLWITDETVTQEGPFGDTIRMRRYHAN